MKKSEVKACIFVSVDDVVQSLDYEKLVLAKEMIEARIKEMESFVFLPEELAMIKTDRIGVMKMIRDRTKFDLKKCRDLVEAAKDCL
jgi:ribosomal protein L7/L12